MEWGRVGQMEGGRMGWVDLGRGREGGRRQGEGGVGGSDSLASVRLKEPPVQRMILAQHLGVGYFPGP